MTRGVRWYLVSSLVLVALVAVAGCSHYMLAEREPWRHEAELTCLNSGAVNDTAGRVRIAAIEGPGACGIDYPLRGPRRWAKAGRCPTTTSRLPPGSIPNSSMPRLRCRRIWPGASPAIQSSALPPVQGAPQILSRRKAIPRRKLPAAAILSGAAAGRADRRPLLLEPPGTSDDDDDGIPGGPPHPYYGEPNAPNGSPAPYPYPQRSMPSQAEQPPPVSPIPPLGPPAPAATASAVRCKCSRRRRSPAR